MQALEQHSALAGVKQPITSSALAEPTSESATFRLWTLDPHDAWLVCVLMQRLVVLFYNDGDYCHNTKPLQPVLRKELFFCSCDELQYYQLQSSTMTCTSSCRRCLLHVHAADLVGEYLLDPRKLSSFESDMAHPLSPNLLVRSYFTSIARSLLDQLKRARRDELREQHKANYENFILPSLL